MISKTITTINKHNKFLKSIAKKNKIIYLTILKKNSCKVKKMFN
jgi:hypothetical protein